MQQGLSHFLSEDPMIDFSFACIHLTAAFALSILIHVAAILVFRIGKSLLRRLHEEAQGLHRFALSKAGLSS